jgi:hypothetical protein
MVGTLMVKSRFSRFSSLQRKEKGFCLESNSKKEMTSFDEANHVQAP